MTDTLTHTAPQLADIPACTVLAIDGEGDPAGDWASTLHVGPYEELPVAYVALLEHLRERGHEPRAPMVETYLADPTVAEPHELVTRLAVAMAPAGGGGPA